MAPMSALLSWTMARGTWTGSTGRCNTFCRAAAICAGVGASDTASIRRPTCLSRSATTAVTNAPRSWRANCCSGRSGGSGSCSHPSRMLWRPPRRLSKKYGGAITVQARSSWARISSIRSLLSKWGTPVERLAEATDARTRCGNSACAAAATMARPCSTSACGPSSKGVVTANAASTSANAARRDEASPRSPATTSTPCAPKTRARTVGIADHRAYLVPSVPQRPHHCTTLTAGSSQDRHAYRHGPRLLCDRFRRNQWSLPVYPDATAEFPQKPLRRRCHVAGSGWGYA